MDYVILSVYMVIRVRVFFGSPVDIDEGVSQCVAKAAQKHEEQRTTQKGVEYTEELSSLSHGGDVSVACIV